MIGDKPPEMAPQRAAGHSRILFVIGQLGRGGAEQQLYSLLASTTLDASIVSLDTTGYWGDRIRALGYPVIELERTRHFELRRLRQVIRIVRSERPALVCIWLDGVGSLYGRIAAVVSRPRCTVVGLRSDPGLFPRWYRGVMRVANRFVTAVVANSTAGATALGDGRLAGGRPVVVIPNGIDAAALREAASTSEHPLPWAADDVVGTVTRLDANKDVGAFIRMAAQVRTSFPGARFVVVGGGPLHSEYEELARSLGLDETMLFLGERGDVPALLASMDVFVLASKSEGLPNVVMEAMAMGLPCVVTAVGDAKLLVSDGETGFVVPAGDVGSIATAVGKLLADRPLAEQMGRRGASRMDAEFTTDRMADEWTALFDRLLVGE
jgi:glycosyltransferase involved in cell wall biosynthesis